MTALAITLAGIIAATVTGLLAMVVAYKSRVDQLSTSQASLVAVQSASDAKSAQITQANSDRDDALALAKSTQSAINADTTKESTDAHDAVLAGTLSLDGVLATPLPGVTGSNPSDPEAVTLPIAKPSIAAVD